MNKKTPTEGDKQPLQEGRKTSTFLNYSKGSIERKEEIEPFEKIKETKKNKK